MSPRDISELLTTAMECTIYVSPKDLWLTYDELMEVGKRVGFFEGEISDVIPKITTAYFGGSKRLTPNAVGAFWGIFAIRVEPDFRNYAALDFIFKELNLRVRQLGQAKSHIERNVLVERGVAEDIPALAMEASITLLHIAGPLIEKNGLVGYKGNGGAQMPLPSEQAAGANSMPEKKHRQMAYDIVKDIVARRTDARPAQIGAFDAFADALNVLQFGQFRLWWTQTAAELKRTDINSSPVSALVLAAALIEGALTFVVKHARAKDIGPFKSSNYSGEPRNWKIDDLVKSAATGQLGAIFDQNLRMRVETVVKARQRIHAGRMLTDFPKGVPDLRPEEAADAKLVAEQAVRCVLDWLQQNP